MHAHLLQAGTILTPDESRIFRQWFLLTVNEQTYKTPNPRWVQRDCAGLVRFAVQETTRTHDEKWMSANSIPRQNLPPELEIPENLKNELSHWAVPGEQGKSTFVQAYALIQENTIFVSKDLNQARPGDLLFYDQGDDQHLMIWTGRSLAYHTGSEADKNKPIKVVHPKELMQWKDTRWKPDFQNPNYLGVYRFAFLSY